MAKIRLLRSLQTTGITEIKGLNIIHRTIEFPHILGRLKSEINIASSSRNRKRKPRKSENELRRANLRWERIKKWSKRVNETTE